MKEENNEIYLEEDNFEESVDNLLTDSKYDVPESVNAYVDTTDGTVVKKEDLTPWEIIKSIAKQNNVEIKDPSKSCKHCFGRGFEGFETNTKMPVPCRCIYRGRTENKKESEALYDSTKLTSKITRLQKRRMAKFFKQQFKIQMKKENKTQSIEITEDIKKEVLQKYEILKSLKKTAKHFNLTLTSVNKIIKESKNNQET
jgi:hypothetical protein